MRLNDYHKMILTFFKVCSSKLKSKLCIIEVSSLVKANFDSLTNDLIIPTIL